MKDSEIIASILNGNMELFREIIKKYQNKIYSYLFYLIQDAYLAEDLTQETFFKCYHHLEKYDENKSKFSTWLSKIAYNTYIDYQRKNKIHITTLEDNEMTNQTVSSPTNDISEILSHLNEIDKQILLLKYIYGFSYEEISIMLKMPVNTLKTRITRAKHFLKRNIRKEEILI